MSLLPTILAHLQHEREPIDRWLLASELAKLDRLRHLYMQSAGIATSQAEFDVGIEEAIKAGLVEESGGKVRLVVAKVESTQGGLF